MRAVRTATGRRYHWGQLGRRFSNVGRTGHVELYSTGREESSTVVNESAVIQTHQMAGRQARGERAHNKNIDYMETQIRQIIRQTCVAVVKRVVRVSRSEVGVGCGQKAARCRISQS